MKAFYRLVCGCTVSVNPILRHTCARHKKKEDR